MKYKSIANIFFINNRKIFAKKLKNNSLCIINSNYEFIKSGDQTFNFKQNADIFYLTGIDQAETILLLFPDFHTKMYTEVLFIKYTSAQIALWEGNKLTIEEARFQSGVKNVMWLSDFDSILVTLIYHAQNIYLNSNENERNNNNLIDGNTNFIKVLKQKYPLHNFLRAAPIFKQLRSVKSQIEVELIKTACNITKDAFNRVLKVVKPNITEYEIEAEIIYEFIKQRATGHAYSPIIASGKNACVLHYNDNNQTCKNGEMILMDFGAEYANYNADLSRTIPVNGKFTKRQRDVYSSVLNVMIEAKKMLVAGTVWPQYQNEVGKIMTSELIGLKLLTKHDVEKQDPKMPAYKKYFMHGTSHHLGLDVHDLASRFEPFAVGNVLTCEPGIYIQEEKLGIRLENNILLTENGPIDLMANIPIEVDEIENLMNT